MDNNIGMLVIVSGPSGSGKDTVVKALAPSGDYAVSVSVTTRGMREGEAEGRDYFFRTPREFIELLDGDQLLEHTFIFGNYYGTPRPYVEAQIALGKNVVLVIEVDGALQVREKYRNSVLIFLLPPTMAELSRRLVQRGTDAAEAVENRLARAQEEVKLLDQYDYLVINDDVRQAARQIDTIVAAERLRPGRSQKTVAHFYQKGL